MLMEKSQKDDKKISKLELEISLLKADVIRLRENNVHFRKNSDHHHKAAIAAREKNKKDKKKLRAKMRRVTPKKRPIKGDSHQDTGNGLVNDFFRRGWLTKFN